MSGSSLPRGPGRKKTTVCPESDGVRFERVDPGAIISELCQRFGVSSEFGRRIRPLAERAASSEPEKRRLILELIERSFAEEARRAAALRASFSPEDWRVITTVASVLHAWRPPGWFDRWDHP